jgi:hypothetical protein
MGCLHAPEDNTYIGSATEARRSHAPSRHIEIEHLTLWIFQPHLDRVQTVDRSNMPEQVTETEDSCYGRSLSVRVAYGRSSLDFETEKEIPDI